MNNFNKKPNTSKFRIPQEEGRNAVIKHFADRNAEKHVLIQIPTGVGKTALIATLPFELSLKKVLVLAPNVGLAGQIEKDIDIISNPDGNIYKTLEIFSDLDSFEFFVLRLEDTASSADIDESHIIVSNYQQLQDVEKWFKGRQNDIDIIIIDEAHHQKAKTYQEIIKFFPDAKVISLTATPFRSDGQKLEGKNIYTYHFKDAVKKGYIRNIKTVNVTPQEVKISFFDEEGKNYSLDQIIEMKEEAWFRKNIALSQDACDSIARKADEKLKELRGKYPKESHQIIAAAMSIRHARENVKPAFEKLGLRVGLVSSQNQDTNEYEIEKLKQGKLDVIVNVGMLGEGFDHKSLGIAAIFRPFASLNPYIQFVGRVIRSNGDTRYCYVVSHLGLNQSARFKEFKLFDDEDKTFLEDLLSNPEKNKLEKKTDDEELFIEDTDNKESQERVKINEVGDKVLEFESQFVKDEKIEDVKKIIEKLSEEEKKSLFKKLGFDYDNVTKKNKIIRIKPKDKRRAEKNLLNEKEKSITVDVIKELGLGARMYYRDFNPLRKNFQWVKQKVSNEVDKSLGIKKNKRNELTFEEISIFINSGKLDQIKEAVLSYFKQKLEDKKYDNKPAK